MAVVALLVGSGVSALEMGRSAIEGAVEQATTFTFELRDYSFHPDTPSLNAGSYVIVARNVGEKRHNLIIDGNGVYKQTREIGAGGQDSFTVDLVPGVYKLYCDIGDHIERGMVGTLTVTAAAAPPSSEPPPAAEEAPPSDDPPAAESAPEEIPAEPTGTPEGAEGG
jgi:plastocyanin